MTMRSDDTFELDDASLEEAIESANLPTLALVLVHLTGDLERMRGALRFKRASPQRPQGGIEEGDARALRADALRILRAFRDGGARLPALPSREALHEMMSYSLGQAVPPEYVSMMIEDMQLTAPPSHAATAAHPAPLAARPDFHVAIIGAGASGIVASIELARMGIGHTLIEKNPDLGGTWFENTYPGCRVDLPSHFYALSFEPNHSWSGYFAPRDEIWAYFKRVATKYGVPERTRFSTEVAGAHYDTASKRWQVELRDRDGRTSTLHANAVISAVGQLNRPSVPQLPGLDSFQGPAFHSARWQHEVDLSQRIGVIGTGASGMQIVPQLAKTAERLVVFQRTPQWAVPNPDYFREVTKGKQWLLRHVPYYAAWFRFRTFYVSADGLHAGLQVDPRWPDKARSLNAENERIRVGLTEYIERELGERRDLLQKALPDYPPFEKRMLLDNAWFRTLTRENVELVTEDIARVTERGVELASGAHHELDALVFATGFQATRFLWPMRIVGAEGKSLSEVWGGDARAHLGITVPGFPSFFMMYGPNTNLAHGGSIIFHSECQARYIAGCMRLLLEGGHAAIDCKPEALQAFITRVDELQARMAWAQPGARNWYRGDAGRVTSTSPFRLVDYWAMTRAPEASDFVLLR
jgi:4-hydroxyacetophenone monooxygenase